MALKLESLTVAALALATLVVVSTALASVAPQLPAEPAALSCIG